MLSRTSNLCREDRKVVGNGGQTKLFCFLKIIFLIQLKFHSETKSFPLEMFFVVFEFTEFCVCFAKGVVGSTEVVDCCCRTIICGLLILLEIFFIVRCPQFLHLKPELIISNTSIRIILRHH